MFLFVDEIWCDCEWYVAVSYSLVVVDLAE